MGDDEKIARDAFSELLNNAKECRSLFERAQVPAPTPLLELLKQEGAPGRIPSPETPDRPSFAGHDWIHLEAEAAHPQTVILAVLRHAGGSLPFEKLRESVLELRPATSSERVREIVNRRGGSLVYGTPDGFSLIRPEKAPFISGKLLWGPSSAFTQFEVAIFRRSAILHILRSTPGGLTKKEVAAELRACNWMVAPVSIDTLREDFDFLEHSIQIRLHAQRWLTTNPVSEPVNRACNVLD